MAVKYPKNELEKRGLLASKLGTFWNFIFGSADYVKDLNNALTDFTIQKLQDLKETKQCLSVVDVPIYHNEFVMPLTLSSADESNSYVDSLTYGLDNVLYGNSSGVTYTYGGNVSNEHFSFDIDSSIKRISFITNRITDPSVVFINGIDFYLDTENSVITFRDSLFENDLIAKKQVSGSRQECLIWLNNVSIDMEFIKTHFGSITNITMPESSNFYRSAVSNKWDCAYLGTSESRIENLLSDLTAAPIAEGNETVEVIDTEDPDRLVIITDKNVYKFHPEANASVAVGDTLIEGQSLTDIFAVYETGGGDIDDDLPSDIAAISLGSSYINGDFIGELIFKNENVDLEYYGQDSSDNTIVKFEVSGFPGDIETFWDQVHSAGVSGGAVLADYLDNRSNGNGPPTAEHLPNYINPMKLIVRNIMGNNILLVKLRPLQLLDEAAENIRYFRLLRNILPPHTSILVYLELEPDSETVNLTETGSASQAGIETDMTTFSGTAVTETCYEETSAPSGDYLTYRDEIITIKAYSGYCAKEV